MARSIGRCVSGLLAGLLLLPSTACKRPETALRERPVQRVEVVQEVQGMTPLEEQALVAQLSEGLGVPAEGPDPEKGPVRVFRLTLKGRPDGTAQWGLGRTWLAATGGGSLMGALVLVPLPGVGNYWGTLAVGAGAGAVVGFGYGPFLHREKQALLQTKGYLPWVLTADWEVLERQPRLGDTVVARSTYGGFWLGLGGGNTHLDLRPHLRPLPVEHRSPDDVREASLQAYGEALIQRVRKKKGEG